MSEIATREGITFEVQGQPIPKQRPRVNNGRAITPQRTRAYETQVGWAARVAMQDREPMRGDVALVLRFKRRGRRRADLDNMTKAILDGINGVVYLDDKQVVRLTAHVEYGADVAGVRVVCREVEA